MSAATQEAAAARGSERLFGLDALRALAVTLVFFAHGSILFVPVFIPGPELVLMAYWGVELFFVLSGFLIGGLLIDGCAGGTRWVPQFWLRRWLRTLPNYYLFLLANIVFVRAVSGEYPDWGAYAFFVQNLAWPHPPFFDEAWSLAVEEVFYLLAPLLAVAVAPFLRDRRSVVAALLAALLLALLARLAYVLIADPLWDSGVRKIALVRLDAIGWGVLAAYACRRFSLSPALRKRMALLALPLLVGVAVAFLSGDPSQSMFDRSALFSLTSAAFALLLPWAERWSGTSLPVPIRRVLVLLALWSYSLYLCHLGLIRAWSELVGAPASLGEAWMVALGFYLPVSLLVAAAAFYGFERPILRLRDRLTHR